MDNVCAPEVIAEQNYEVETGVTDLNALQLAFVGGGIGDVVGH
jgi:hypothetical protein